MKKNLLLGATALVSALSFGQAGFIAPDKALDDFKAATEFSDQYSIITEEDIFPCDAASTDSAYMGIFTFADTDTDNIKFTQTRNTTEGQLELTMSQAKGSFEPFGFIFGSFCDNGSEGSFTLDLSENANISFSVEITNYVDLGPTSGDTTNGGTGVQLKIQAEDINGVSLAFDQSFNDVGTDPWRYEIGITGDGTQISNFNGKDHFLVSDGEVNISYDLKNAIPSNATGDAPDLTKTFDYSQVKSIKITFVSNNKDPEAGFVSWPYEADFVLKNLGLGVDPVGLGNNAEELSAGLYPNPATSEINFTEELENVTVYNAQGVAVFTSAKTSSINVSTLESGMYTVQSSKGSKTFVVK